MTVVDRRAINGSEFEDIEKKERKKERKEMGKRQKEERNERYQRRKEVIYSISTKLRREFKNHLKALALPARKSSENSLYMRLAGLHKDFG
jgi:hypothetical protein